MKYRWIVTQEDVSNSFTVDITTLDGVEINEKRAFPYSCLSSATPRQLADMGIESYTPPTAPPYVPPAAGSNEYAVQNPLEPYQFFAMIDMLGKRQELADAISAIQNNKARTVAKARLNHARIYRRDSPLFVALGAAVNITPEQIDTAWADAVSLQEEQW